LAFGEANQGVSSLVPEAVALAQVAELNSDDTGEGWADQATVQRSLGQTAYENVKR